MSGAAQAQTQLGEDPFSVIMKWRPTTDKPDMPDFVKKSRPPDDQLNYTPLTGDETKRPKRMTPAEVSAQMKQLDAAGAGARARAAAAFPAKKARRPAKAD
ncbi:MAG: hypothetical protein KGM42_18960 [Hyphomicrobiales bacterium]|nr:hypothetical protein [Hyphomicrobiales bacterium]